MEKRQKAVEKWGAKAITSGFTVIPNHLLTINQYLSDETRLSSTELLVLLQIVGSWWEADQLPFPSKGTLATRAGLSPRQVQRALARLESLNLIKRIMRLNAAQGRASNAYDLSGAVELVQRISETASKVSGSKTKDTNRKPPAD